MTKEDLKKLQLPDAPGVYFFLAKDKKILYIGKATSLKNRVKSYFSKSISESRSPLIEKMVTEASYIDYTETDSVLEALILETNLIQSNKPRYNTKTKDDKSYNHVIITNEDLPRVLVVRGKDITEKFDDSQIKYHFGPFTSAGLLREAIKIIRKTFSFYDTQIPIGQEKSKMAKGKLSFNRQIGLYPAEGDLKEYKQTINHLRLFFQGKKKKIIEELERDMKRQAKNLDFESADKTKKKIFALRHIKDISLIRNDFSATLNPNQVRIEAFDIAHLSGKNMVGVMTVVINDEASRAGYKKFKINTVKDANDPAALKEVIERRLRHLEWGLPDIIVTDGNKVQQAVVERALTAAKLSIPVLGVVKDEKHKASRLIGDQKLIKTHKFAILLANAEAHRFAINYYRNLQRKSSLL